MIVDWGVDFDHANAHDIIDQATGRPLPMEPPWDKITRADDHRGIVEVCVTDDEGQFVLNEAGTEVLRKVIPIPIRIVPKADPKLNERPVWAGRHPNWLSPHLDPDRPSVSMRFESDLPVDARTVSKVLDPKVKLVDIQSQERRPRWWWPFGRQRWIITFHFQVQAEANK